MYTKYFGAAVLLCVLVVSIQGRPEELSNDATTTTEVTTWDKIKKGVEHGWNVAYDETHCAFHKVKELVKHHDHESENDPCINKPYQQPISTTPKSLVLIAEDRIPVNTQRP